LIRASLIRVRADLPGNVTQAIRIDGDNGNEASSALQAGGEKTT
jgi:hypothetical protein